MSSSSFNQQNTASFAQRLLSGKTTTVSNRKRSDKYFRDHISLRIPGDDEIDHDPRAPCKENFKLYTMDLSYFSGKLEIYLKYKGISHKRIEPHGFEFDSILYENTGNEQLPMLYDCRPATPNHLRWLRDTTPLIEYLEKDLQISATGSLSVIPSCEVQAYFQYLFEDFADEYLWRPALFWRWEPDFDRLIMGHRFTYELARTTPWRYILIPLWVRHLGFSLRQWLLSSYGEDCTTQAKKEIVKEQYYELLEIMEEILQAQPFLFGNRPTLIDIGFAGPFFRHFSHDFTPRKVMEQRAPAVYEWLARLWNSHYSKVNQLPTGFPLENELPKNWLKLLTFLPEYLHYYHLNALAYSQGKKFFTWNNRGENFTVPVVPYRVWCRKELQKKFLAITSTEKRETIQRLLTGVRHPQCEFSAWECLWKDGMIGEFMAPECNCEPPFTVPPSSLPAGKRTRLAYKWDHYSIFVPYFVKEGMKWVGYLSMVSGVAMVLWKRWEVDTIMKKLLK